MRCLSCQMEFPSRDAGTCKRCHVKESETVKKLEREIEELKRENETLNSQVSFLRFSNNSFLPSAWSNLFNDVVLIASSDPEPIGSPMPVPAHKAVLGSRSPVFKAMLETEMVEKRSGTISIPDVSSNSLRAFINFLYTAEASLDEKLACDLLVLSDKYQVMLLKDQCEKYLASRLIWPTAVSTYVFAHQNNAKILQEAALSLIAQNMDKIRNREEYAMLVEKDPRLIVEIYEAFLSRKVDA